MWTLFQTLSKWTYILSSILIHFGSLLFLCWTPSRIIVLALFVLFPLFCVSCLVHYLSSHNNKSSSKIISVVPSNSSSSSSSSLHSPQPVILCSSSNLSLSSTSPLTKRRHNISPLLPTPIPDPLAQLTDRLDRMIVTSPKSTHDNANPSRITRHCSFIQKSSVGKFLKVLNFLLIWFWVGFLAWLVFSPYYVYQAEINAVHFVRLGHTTSSTINLTVRYTQSEITVQYKPVTQNNWITLAQNQVPSLDSDYLVYYELRGLVPNTAYMYRIVSKSGIPVGLESTFRTAFDATSLSSSTLSMTFGSCILQNTPWVKEVGVRGFRDILNQPALQPRSDVLLFLGDFIYSDVPWSFGDSVESYRWYYKYTIRVPEVQQVLQSISSYFVYDDHEIRNNWSSGTSQPFPAARQGFMDYLGTSNPPLIDQGSGGGHYNFTRPPVCTFVMDTRRFRDPGSVPKSMLGSVQLESLKAWLVTPMPCTWRVLATSVPMTKNFRNVDGDTWGEYLDERNAILQYIHDWKVKNVLVVSGDRHDSAIQDLEPYSEVTEFSVSPITNFYIPVSVYSADKGDRVLYKAAMGPVRVGRFDFTSNRVKFQLWDGDRIAYSVERDALV